MLVSEKNEKNKKKTLRSVLSCEWMLCAHNLIISDVARILCEKRNVMVYFGTILSN